MSTTPTAAVASAGTPSATNNRMSSQPNTVPPTSTSTPQGFSQDPSTSFRSSFLHSALDTQENAIDPAATSSFPPSTAFTFIPELYNLISRLKVLEGTPQFKAHSSTTNSRPPTASPLLNRDSNSLGPTAKLPTNGNTTKGISQDPKAGSAPTTTTLELKDIPEHVYEIKQAIQAARDTVAGLPDIKRTIPEQEREIDILQGKVNGLKKRMNELASIAADGSVATGSAIDTTRHDLHVEEQQDVVMEGVEGPG